METRREAGISLVLIKEVSNLLYSTSAFSNSPLLKNLPANFEDFCADNIDDEINKIKTIDIFFPFPVNIDIVNILNYISSVITYI